MEGEDLLIRVDDDTELRLLREEHAQAVFEVVVANREHLRPFLPFPDTTRRVEDTLEFITGSLEGWAKGVCVQTGIWHRGRVVGCLGTAHMSREHDAVEIGYWLAEDAQGQGLMSRCCGAFIDYLVRDLGVHRVVIRIDLENRRSLALAERLGFTREGVQRDACKLHGSYHDLMVYSMLSHEWPGAPQREASPS